MKTTENLKLLNSLTIAEYDADGECLYYANVANTPDNEEVLKRIGVPVEEIESMTDIYGEQIDISGIAWKYTPATWFDGDVGFVLNRPDVDGDEA